MVLTKKFQFKCNKVKNIYYKKIGYKVYKILKNLNPNQIFKKILMKKKIKITRLHDKIYLKENRYKKPKESFVFSLN